VGNLLVISVCHSIGRNFSFKISEQIQRMELKCNPVRAGVDVKIYHIYSTG